MAKQKDRGKVTKTKNGQSGERVTVRNGTSSLFSPWLMAIGVLAIAGLAHMRLNGGDGVSTMAKASQGYAEPILSGVPCQDYAPIVPGCTPSVCGRAVVDGLFTDEMVAKMRNLAEKGMAFGGGSGGVTILDLHTGAVSKGDRFINAYQSAGGRELFTTEDIQAYKQVKETIRNMIQRTFNVTGLYLTNPTFFSRITDAPPKTDNDMYWMPHIDRDTYGSFVYTSLLYLNTMGVDYQGGGFVFLDDNDTRQTIIEPRAGRVSFFTSGAENKHHVAKVTSGVRYAITVSFTCSAEAAIQDPQLGVDKS